MSETLSAPQPVHQKIIDEIHARELEYIAADDELGGGYFFSPDDLIGSAAYHIDRPVIKKLARLAGFVFVPEKLDRLKPAAAAIGIPDPERFSNAVNGLRIPIQFISEATENGEIPAELYVRTYQQGIYPIGVDNLDLYVHDVSDDHFLAVAFGGLRIRRYLQREADVDFEDHDLAASRAENIDDATDSLSHAITWLILEPKNYDITAGFKGAAHNFAHTSPVLITSEFLQEHYTRRLKRLGFLSR